MIERRAYGKAIPLALVSFFLYFFHAYFLDRSSTGSLLISVVLLFAAYGFLILRSNILSDKFLFASGTAFRLVLLLWIPWLSDDFYRFIWDGLLLNSSQNPYEFLPSEMLLEIENKEVLLDRMNSPDYYSVYPPFLQYIFAFATYVAPSSIKLPIVIMRLTIILAEIGSYFLLRNILKELKLNPQRAFLYYLNPLIIIELSGNLHFEGVMIFFSLLAIYLLVKAKKDRSLLASLSLTLAFLTKLIPLLLAPVLWRKLRHIQRWVFVIATLIFVLLISLPLINFHLILNIFNSLDLYFQSFEFNASIYYLARWLGISWKGYNLIAVIGPVLSTTAGICIFYLLLIKKSSSWRSSFQNLLFALSIYYALATTVHPWYLAYLLLFASFTNYFYPVLWSLLVFLSYWAYGSEMVNESYWILLIEYLPIYYIAIRELRAKPMISAFSKDNLSLQESQT